LNRVLVTGATGFTARHVIPILERRGFHVSCLSSSDGDIRDSAAVRDLIVPLKPDYVLHLAGTPNLPDSQAEIAHGVNVEGTVNVLRACERLAQPPRKVILVSSSFVYGDTGAVRAGEDAPFAPTGAYGRSKCEMEQAAAHWFGRMSILIARPFNYTGVGHAERFLVPKLVRAFRERSCDVSFVDPNVVRDYSDVRWVANVYADLLQRAESSLAINVCSGVGTPLPAIVELLEKLTGHSVAIKPRPTEGSGKAALVGSSARLSRLLGTPSPYSLADTLRWMVETPAPERQVEAVSQPPRARSSSRLRIHPGS
jgi:GDP-6-deoxy-D-talose 4-dehydrogenase